MTDAPDRKTIQDLLAVMADLRRPGSGCPWDLEQTFSTIAPYTIEEAYEVADAIERGDMAELKEELGDLLLQVVYHAQMAREIRAFEFGDVVDGIVRKMVRRHPHVFGDAEAKSSQDITGLWDRIKGEEKRARYGSARGALAGVPVALPALTRAMKLQERAAKVGFDWPELAPVLSKVREEFDELETALSASAPKATWQEELGDLLFALVNMARHVRIDPEMALRAANAKFERRFAWIEARLAEDGRRAEELDLAELDRLWNEAKAGELKDAEGKEGR